MLNVYSNISFNRSFPFRAWLNAQSGSLFRFIHAGALLIALIKAYAVMDEQPTLAIALVALWLVLVVFKKLIAPDIQYFESYLRLRLAGRLMLHLCVVITCVWAELHLDNPEYLWDPIPELLLACAEMLTIYLLLSEARKEAVSELLRRVRSLLTARENAIGLIARVLELAPTISPATAANPYRPSMPVLA